MNKAIIIGAVAVVAVGAAGAYAFTQQSVSSAVEGDSAIVAVSTGAEVNGITKTPSGGFLGDVVMGNEDAPVTVIEYASLTCPHCASFHEDTYPAFKEKYVDTGKVRFIFRDYPLDNFAVAASIIARCGTPDRHPAFIELFLEQQKTWSGAENVLGELKRLASLGGLSGERIDACLDDQDLGQGVIDAARVGQDEFGIRSTPSFVVNGELKSGAMNLDQFSEVIEPLL